MHCACVNRCTYVAYRTKPGVNIHKYKIKDKHLFYTESRIPSAIKYLRFRTIGKLPFETISNLVISTMGFPLGTLPF